MEKFDFQNVKFEQNTLKSAKYYDFFAKGFIYVFGGINYEICTPECYQNHGEINQAQNNRFFELFLFLIIF